MDVPPGSTPIATDPSSFAPLFVLDTAGQIDVLRRVATLKDYAELAHLELEYIDVKTADPAVAAILFNNSRAGDVLRIASPPHWLQEQAPYDTGDFTLAGIPSRVFGTAPQVYTGREISLPGYVFADDDIGRWVNISGFSTSGNNGLVQILSVMGLIATTTKTFSAPQTGAAWSFPWAQINTYSGPSTEPKFFPTRTTGLAWELRRSGSPLTAGVGGVTRRHADDPLVRSQRMTFLAPTLDSAVASFDYVGAALVTLQKSMALNDTAFTALLTRTVGP